MALKKKISADQFLEDIINKELSIIGVQLTFKDILADHQLPENEQKYHSWYQDFAFKTPEQFLEWKNYVLEHFFDWQPKYLFNKRRLNEEFSWINLQYGLSLDFPYQDIYEAEVKLKQARQNKDANKTV